MVCVILQWRMKNVIVQVIKTNSELTNQIENVLISSIKTFKNIFHAYQS